MQIDWFTFGAQLVNFLILVGLLRRFLYTPILHAMDEREARISSRLEEAREKQTTAEAEVQKYRSMQDELERQRQEQLAEAEREAAERRQTLIQEARQEVEHLEREWREALHRERESFLHELSERAIHETIAVARRALGDLADAEIEVQATAVFMERLQSLDGEQRRDLIDALQTAGGAAVVRSSFELSTDRKKRMQDLLAEQIEEAPDLSFETDPEIGFGIELRVGERKVAWSLDSYLEHLTEHVQERLDAELRKGHSPAEEEVGAGRASTNEE